ncbi:imidazole glycerol phosphate synthase subunit HisH [Hahella sp. NBU794]|uniref:imidazole glycerol phosphate synthase subunit HisH n=1 Tax=Hahella sp. NBU794 TaxID=3422590 RepID=UPI003D6EF4B8
MNIGVLNYGMGNIKSVLNAIDAVGYDAHVVAAPDQLAELTHLIIPGVGAFGNAMANLASAALLEAIHDHVQQGRPLMGVCLGMQLLATQGEEGGVNAGLDLIPGVVRHLEVDGPVPHVGWNALIHHQEHPIFQGVKKHVDFYFVHSYYFAAQDRHHVIAETEYGASFPVVVGRDNIVGVQFHPEKSQDNGLKILENFCEWDGRC